MARRRRELPPHGSIDHSGTHCNKADPDHRPLGTGPASLKPVVVRARRFPASEVTFGSGDLRARYRVIRRVAPSCFDAVSIRSGDAIRIMVATEDDSALIDVRFSRARTQLELVDHPCVAQIVDQGVLPNGRPWVASRRPPGTPLSDVLARRNLEPRETVAFIYSVAGVLAHAHDRSVVHGSLRPHHLTLSRGAKVSISGWEWLRTPGIPAFGDPTSTSVFNAPEHDGQSPIDGRADVYALGAIAYRALTGVFPDVSRDLLDTRSTVGAVIENMLALDARDRATPASIIADLHEQRRAVRGSSTELDQQRTDRMPLPAMELSDLSAAEEATDLSAAEEATDLSAAEEATEESPPLVPCF